VIIVAADVRRLELRLTEPYTIAYETYDRTTNLFIRLVDELGNVGQGCAAPTPEVTGESAEGCERALLRVAGMLQEDPAVAVETDQLRRAPAAAAAVEMARIDLRAQRLGVPAGELLGSLRGSAATSITLGIMETEEMLRRAAGHVAAGFRALKIKGGQSAVDDADRLHRLREALGTGIELRFDANQGYDVETTLRLAAAIAGIGVTVLEQPTPASEPDALSAVLVGLRQLRDTGRQVPALMADESATDLLSAARLVIEDRVEALNIKLMKIGGIAPAQALDRLAAAAGLPTMVSCMDEAALSIAAGLQFALASANVRWVDLDGHLDLVDDPSAPAVRLREGLLSPGRGPGFGCPDLA